MQRRGTVEKALLYLTAFGTLLTVAALVLFALGGSGFGADVLRSVSGFVLGMAAVAALTRSPQRGRPIAALVLLVTVAGCLALVLAGPGSLLAFVEQEPGWARFVSGLVGSTAGVSLLRLLGFNPLGPRGAQASRRRS